MTMLKTVVPFLHIMYVLRKIKLIEVNLRRTSTFPLFTGSIKCRLCGYTVILQYDFMSRAYGEMWRHFKQKHSDVLEHVIKKYVGSPRDRKVTEYICR